MAQEEAATALTPAELGALLRRLHGELARHREEIDELNVFPVPDGDTGSNLVMTVRAAVDAVAGETDQDAPAAMMRGALMGARGNSGVILSQVLRALGEAVNGEAEPAVVYRQALVRARELAYEALGDPVEGTMLTAIRVAAETVETADDGEPVAQLSARVLAAVTDAVQRTREQLEANRDAGVVDAGARGYEVHLRALHDHLTGAPADDHAPPPLVARDRTAAAEREAGSLEYRFEVQYLLQAGEEHAAELRDRLGELGDSVIVTGAGGLLNVHVHTNRVGEAIEAGIAFGEPSRVEVTAFADQLAERAAASSAGADVAATGGAATGGATPGGDGSARSVAPVVVLDGDGLVALAQELDATVVPGTAGRLPTVADLLNAIAHTRGERIAILPGHRNAVPTAHQASAVSVAEGGRELLVVEEAADAVSVLAALAVCDPTGEAGTVVDDMRAAAAACHAGEVVHAVRDAELPAGPVRRGQPLAVVDGEVRGAFDEPVAALLGLADALDAGSGEVVTLVVGSSVEQDEAAHARRALVELLGDGPELEVVDGGQDPPRYVLGVE